MTRKAHSKNVNHPLHQLRQILGVTQERLSKILAQNIRRLQSLETGKRRQGILPADLLQLILDRLGASWSLQTEKCMCSFDLSVPYTRENYNVWRNMMFDRAEETQSLIDKVTTAMSAVSDRKVVQFSDDLASEIYRLVKKHEIPVDDKFQNRLLLIISSEKIKRHPIRWVSP